MQQTLWVTVALSICRSRARRRNRSNIPGFSMLERVLHGLTWAPGAAEKELRQSEAEVFWEKWHQISESKINFCRAQKLQDLTF